MLKKIIYLIVSGGLLLSGCSLDYEPLNGPSSGSFPASVEEATASLDRLKTQKMLKGFRGQPALNKQKFGEYIATISEIMSQCDIIKEIDINPLIQLHDGSLTAVDSVFTLKHWSVCSMCSFWSCSLAFGYCHHGRCLHNCIQSSASYLTTI